MFSPAGRLESRWRRGFDSLFARVLLMQAVVALMTAGLFGALTLRHQAQVLAHATAPRWAQALRSGGWLTTAKPPKGEPRVDAEEIQLLPGPPPAVATPFLLMPRLRAFQQVLGELGVPVQELRVSGQTGDSVIWLLLEHDAGQRWVGIRSELEGIDALERGSLGLALGALTILLTAWWLTRRVVRPLAELQEALQRFQMNGELPGPPQAGGPAEVRDLALQFAAFARQQQDLDRQRHHMLAGISHDLRSPLARIRMAAEFLPGEGPLAARRELITRNVHTLDRLLGDFIDMARAEQEALHQRVDLRQLVLDVLDDTTWADAGVRLLTLPTAEVWVQPANAAMLERALRNLLENACRHGQAPVELSLETSRGLAVLAVRDHGPGIPVQLRETLCQPFQRGEASRSTPGTGLGLAIARRTAERHGGRLELADAHPGLQALMTLPLPA